MQDLIHTSFYYKLEELIDKSDRPLMLRRYPDENAGQIPMAFVVRGPESTLSESEVMEFVSKQVNYHIFKETDECKNNVLTCLMFLRKLMHTFQPTRS